MCAWFPVLNKRVPKSFVYYGNCTVMLTRLTTGMFYCPECNITVSPMTQLIPECPKCGTHSAVSPKPSTLTPSTPQTKNKSRIVIISASFVGPVIALVAAHFIPFSVTVRCASGAVVGLFLGLIPYFTAKRLQNMKLARWSLGISSLCGMLGGVLLAIPASVIFMIAILVSKQPNK